MRNPEIHSRRKYFQALVAQSDEGKDRSKARQRKSRKRDKK